MWLIGSKTGGGGGGGGGGEALNLESLLRNILIAKELF